MKRTLDALLVLLVMSPATTRAQEPVQVSPGDRVRVTSTDLSLPNRQAEFLAVVGDSLFVRIEGNDLAFPLTAVKLLEVYQGRRHGGKGVTVGALAGGAAGTVVGAILAPELVLPGLGVGASVGAAMGAGARARTSFLIGTGVGAGSGALVGAIAGADFSEGQYWATIFAVFGAAGGAAVGSIIGLIRGEDHWKEVSLQGIQPLVKAFPDGRVGLGISFSLRR